MRAGTETMVRRMVPVRLDQLGIAGEGASGPGEIERHHYADEPGGVCGEPAPGEMREGGVVEIRVHLLDDRMMTVECVGGDGAEIVRSVVVKKAWNRQMSNSVPWSCAFLGRRSGIRRTTSRPVIC